MGCQSDGFFFSNPPVSAGSIGLWIIPWIVLWEESRKWILRREMETSQISIANSRSLNELQTTSISSV